MWRHLPAKYKAAKQRCGMTQGRTLNPISTGPIIIWDNIQVITVPVDALVLKRCWAISRHRADYRSIFNAPLVISDFKYILLLRPHYSRWTTRLAICQGTSSVNTSTRCDIMTSYGVMHLDQYWLVQLHGASSAPGHYHDDIMGEMVSWLFTQPSIQAQIK